MDGRSDLAEIFVDNIHASSGSLYFSVCIFNVSKIKYKKNLVSSSYFVQDIPIYIEIDRQANINEDEIVKINLIFGKEQPSEWKLKSTVEFLSTKFREMDKRIDAELSNTNRTIEHTIQWPQMRHIENLMFDLSIKCEKSNGNNYKGIVNESATCYANSLLQSLFHIPAFRRKIYAAHVDEDDTNESCNFG